MFNSNLMTHFLHFKLHFAGFLWLQNVSFKLKEGTKLWRTLLGVKLENQEIEINLYTYNFKNMNFPIYNICPVMDFYPEHNVCIEILNKFPVCLFPQFWTPTSFASRRNLLVVVVQFCLYFTPIKHIILS